ncbi:MAG: hypothetical protein HFP78_01930 [Methylococcales symbiont of Hymedesmia sp. n. MRB-2018]|nr:MAG: hypothetical protein HFP78_01930 [Methylococcales symbiont of Hymedesmia sp. n. MRB-2018]
MNMDKVVGCAEVSYYQKDDEISSMQRDILKKYCIGSLSLPSEKQAKILYQLYNKAIAEGVMPSIS